MVKILGTGTTTNSIKNVESKPFGGIDLVALSRREHNSIGDLALQQQRRRQLNELLLEFRKRAPLGMPNPSSGKYNDKPNIIEGSFFSSSDWKKAVKGLG